MDEQTFMDDLYKAFDDRAQVILSRVDSHDWDVLVGVIESTDRVQHMMWRFMDRTHPMYDAALAAKYGDSIERVYRRADQFVGEVAQRLDPDTAFLIVSDHGFHSWRKAVNLNTWLVASGVHDAPRAAAGREEAGRSLRRRRILGERRLEPHPRLRDGAGTDLLQPSRPRSPAGSSARAPKRRSSRESSANVS